MQCKIITYKQPYLSYVYTSYLKLQRRWQRSLPQSHRLSLLKGIHLLAVYLQF
ncbi:hypothetical protein VAEKB19_3510075 [Vibrio aestuarianus]|nr:hypothetical protein VAEKB19_3510075 [Vibrio aestuarianus]